MLGKHIDLNQCFYRLWVMSPPCLVLGYRGLWLNWHWNWHGVFFTYSTDMPKIAIFPTHSSNNKLASTPLVCVATGFWTIQFLFYFGFFLLFGVKNSFQKRKLAFKFSTVNVSCLSCYVTCLSCCRWDDHCLPRNSSANFNQGKVGCQPWHT
jgi:hypothetical protein